MSTLYIDEASMEKKIEELKIQKARMDKVLEAIKGETLKITDYWTGDTGDAVHETLDEYTNEFDYISSKLEKHITELEKVVREYRSMEGLTRAQIANNNETAAI